MAKYESSRSFRVALEERLKRRASSASTALDRLRKEAAHQRLLARLADVAPADSWALKGGLALIARLGSDARATKDADATWRQSIHALPDIIVAIAECDLNDYFEFQIGLPKAITAEGPEGGQRYPIIARLDGREFERLQLDINVLPDDPRPIETIPLRNLMDFAGMTAPTVPVVKIEQHLAEKLHAYTRIYTDGENSRAKDLFDMLTIAHRIELPTSQKLADACQQTFLLRSTPWPPTIAPPPTTWSAAWRGFARDYGLAWIKLDQAFNALSEFWQPVLRGVDTRAWDRATWTWQPQDEK